MDLLTNEEMELLEKKINEDQQIKERIGGDFEEYKAEVETITPLIEKLRVYASKDEIEL